MDTRERRIIEEVDRLADNILDFACRLVARPSMLLQETPALSVMEEELRRFTLTPVRVAMASLKQGDHPPGSHRPPGTMETGTTWSAFARRRGRAAEARCSTGIWTW